MHSLVEVAHDISDGCETHGVSDQPRTTYLGYSNCGGFLNTHGGLDLLTRGSKRQSNEARLNWPRAWLPLRLPELTL